MRLIQLTQIMDADETMPLWLNPEYVTAVQPALDRPTTTHIETVNSSRDVWHVMESPQEVAAMCCPLPLGDVWERGLEVATPR